MTYLTGTLKEDYLNDLAVVQEYAALNRKTIASVIMKGMKWKGKEEISCIHNYVDLSGDKPVLRKGAISAAENEDVIIPVNMKEGVILGKAKKNDVAEECRFAYKDIDEVMEQQSDLVHPIRKMRTVGVLKE